MKKLAVVLLSGVSLMLSAHAYSQGKVEVTWENTDKYTDVRPSNESRKRFKERTFKQLDEYLVELAEALSLIHISEPTRPY